MGEATAGPATDAGVTVRTGTDLVTARIVDGVGVVTLNRPRRRNALHPEMFDGVPVALERFATDPEVGCVLITGAGSAFCAGGDVRDGRARRAAEVDPPPSVAQRSAALTEDARMVRLLHEFPKITLAALPGPAVGAGIGIALSTDLRIAGRSAALIPGWGKLALSGDFGGTWFLSRLVGPSRALEILLDGSPVGAEAARTLGLFNRVVEDAELSAAALDWARELAAGPRLAWARIKANVAQAQYLSLAEALPLESERMVRSGATAEHKDAVRAWLAAAAVKKPR
ncbi:enoyl-CoA hydratase/isomerase family protein [Nocardia higoensis]|uniref:enoyl-CoA hydratase/isomerase family protein n=1 Tax=Nocardia higoensis TaxID=228599 RepID=UPI00031734E5|nr:enoyl-CoA hydratase-related protein [Nocardia higoensis]